MPEKRDRKFQPNTVTLECGCQLVYKASPPRAGQQVWCRRHQDYIPVLSKRQHIMLRCLDCRYSRVAGIGGENTLTMADAEDLATRHVSKPQSMSHTVLVVSTDGTEKRIRRQGQEEIPGVNRALERAAEVRKHGRSLRGLGRT